MPCVSVKKYVSSVLLTLLFLSAIVSRDEDASLSRLDMIRRAVVMEDFGAVDVMYVCNNVCHEVVSFIGNILGGINIKLRNSGAKAKRRALCK